MYYNYYCTSFFFITVTHFNKLYSINAILWDTSNVQCRLMRCNDFGVSAVSKYTGTTTYRPDGLLQLLLLYVLCSCKCNDADRMNCFTPDNVKKALAEVDKNSPLVKEGEEMRKVRYQGTPMAIYRHILMSEIRTATAALPPVSRLWCSLDFFIC